MTEPSWCHFLDAGHSCGRRATHSVRITEPRSGRLTAFLRCAEHAADTAAAWRAGTDNDVAVWVLR